MYQEAFEILQNELKCLFGRQVSEMETCQIINAVRYYSERKKSCIKANECTAETSVNECESPRNNFSVSEWQLCPKCNGDGYIRAVQVGSCSPRTYDKCDVCNGEKILVKPLVAEKINSCK